MVLKLKVAEKNRYYERITSLRVDVYSSIVNTGMTIVRQNIYIRVRGFFGVRLADLLLRREASTWPPPSDDLGERTAVTYSRGTTPAWRLSRSRGRGPQVGLEAVH